MFQYDLFTCALRRAGRRGPATLLCLVLLGACTGLKSEQAGPAQDSGHTDGGEAPIPDTGSTDDSGIVDSGRDSTPTETGDDTSDTGDPLNADRDGDGYPARVDCDDETSSVHPNAEEQCDNHVDDDCDGRTDRDDAVSCERDGDGYAVADGDCDDNNSSVRPGALETCNDIDDDCDGVTDEDATDAPTWYLDADADGYVSNTTAVACDAPTSYIAKSSEYDCNDLSSGVHPDAAEICEGSVDENCDGYVDENCSS